MEKKFTWKSHHRLKKKIFKLTKFFFSPKSGLEKCYENILLKAHLIPLYIEGI